MMQANEPPDGYADEASNEPPDGYADEQAPPASKPSIFSRAKDAYDQGVGAYNKYVEPVSPVGLLKRANTAIRTGADYLGEKVATSPSLEFMGPTARGLAGGLVANAPDIAMTAGPLFAKPAAKALGFLENMGGRALNNSAGIRQNTLGSMAKGENPSIFGAKLGQSLYDDGAVGNNAAQTFDRTQKLFDKSGESVGEAIGAIKSAGKEVSLDVNEALQPLVEAWTARKGSMLTANKNLARPIEEAYTGLVSKAKAGRLGLDELRDALKEAGEAMGNAGKDTPKEAAYSELYGLLADVRDQMVSKVAQYAQNPKLADNLMKANAQFSKYARIMPDIYKASAKEGVKALPGIKFDLTAPLKSLESIQPILAKGAIAVGRNVKVGGNVAASGAAVGNKVLDEKMARKYWDQAKSEGLTGEAAKKRARELANGSR